MTYLLKSELQWNRHSYFCVFKEFKTLMLGIDDINGNSSIAKIKLNLTFLSKRDERYSKLNISFHNINFI